MSDNDAAADALRRRGRLSGMSAAVLCAERRLARLGSVDGFGNAKMEHERVAAEYTKRFTSDHRHCVIENAASFTGRKDRNDVQTPRE